MNDIWLVQLATNDIAAMKRFAQKACRVNQQRCGGQRDQKLLGRGSIEALDVAPDVVDQLVQRVAGLPIGKLKLSNVNLGAGRDVAACRGGGRIETRIDLRFQFFQIIVGLLDRAPSAASRSLMVPDAASLAVSCLIVLLSFIAAVSAGSQPAVQARERRFGWQLEAQASACLTIPCSRCGLQSDGSSAQMASINYALYRGECVQNSFGKSP